METKPYSSRPFLRLAALAAIGILILGFIFPALGAWTGLVMSAWLIGTQKPWRGFLFVFLIAFVPAVILHWGKLPMGTLAYLGWMFVGALISALPYFLHRLISPRLKGMLSTLVLPLWGVVFHAASHGLLPMEVFNAFSLVQTQQANTPLMQAVTTFGSDLVIFLMFWLAAVINWLWDHDFQREKVTTAVGTTGVVFVIMFGYGLFREFNGGIIALDAPPSIFMLICVFVALGLEVWAFTRPSTQSNAWTKRPETVALLRSPFTGEALQVVNEKGQESLVSASGEKFPIQNGIPNFLRPEDLTGSNQKYNQLKIQPTENTTNCMKPSAVFTTARKSSRAH